MSQIDISKGGNSSYKESRTSIVLMRLIRWVVRAIASDKTRRVIFLTTIIGEVVERKALDDKEYIGALLLRLNRELEMVIDYKALIIPLRLHRWWWDSYRWVHEAFVMYRGGEFFVCQGSIQAKEGLMDALSDALPDWLVYSRRVDMFDDVKTVFDIIASQPEL